MDALTPEIMIMLALLCAAFVIFAFELLRIDLAALCIMAVLGLLNQLPGLHLLNQADLFIGFSSNAVIAIIAVMIIGKALDKTGALQRLADAILRSSGNSEKRVSVMVALSAGLISGFMQNAGAAALFIPVINRIAAHTFIPIARLLLPMAFCTIVGGTLTMVGSSPLILLNDLLPTHSKPFGLFEVTALGVLLLGATLIYFLLTGRYILPKHATRVASQADNAAEYFKRLYAIEAEIYELNIPAGNPLVGLTVEVVETRHPLRIIAAQARGEDRIAPARNIVLEAGSTIAILASSSHAHTFAQHYNLSLNSDLKVFAESLTPSKAGISELVIPPFSGLIGKTVGEIWMRKTYGLSVINIHRGQQNLYQGIRDIPLQAGDTLVCHSSWQNLSRLLSNRDFIVVNTEFPHEHSAPHKMIHALTALGFSLVLLLLTQLPLALIMLCGALSMIVSGVLKIDEAYQAISWRTVFLLAGLIPLGLAMQTSGTAAWLAQALLLHVQHLPLWAIQAALALLATFFSLMFSNVGATIMLVPLAANIAEASGADPRLFALTVALAACNAFILPTNQVNALIMGPGAYHVKDFLRAGLPLTFIFIFVMMLGMQLFY